ncbi:MAG: hypothetical protein CL433_00515 [Acidimicrobiaceae bacterium]|nr:hypothetical protein [Acidimicrobiaceae bacterium]
MPASDNLVSDFDTRRPLALLAVALLAVAPLSWAFGTLDEDANASSAEQLLEPPSANGVWVLGNSIFKTGVDPDSLEEQLGGPPVDFEYHGGHYTSLWYLITTHALPSVDEYPRVVVWGFRPAYAALPAFRQNTANSTELFLPDDTDPTYAELAEGIEQPDRHRLDDLASELDSFAASTSIWRARDEASSWMADIGLALGVAMADAVGADGGPLVRREVIEGDSSVLDLLNQVTTGGMIELAEERVVDGVGDFVVGDTATYADSFIPIIADRIDDLGIRQLIIIWPPRAKAEGTPTEQDDIFVSDAASDLEAKGFEVLNLYDDARFNGLDFYAEGDHFNVAGRDAVTALLAEELSARGLNDT